MKTGPNARKDEREIFKKWRMCARRELQSDDGLARDLTASDGIQFFGVFVTLDEMIYDDDAGGMTRKKDEIHGGIAIDRGVGTDGSAQFGGATDEVRVGTIGFATGMYETQVKDANHDRPLTVDPAERVGIDHYEHGWGRQRGHS